MLQLASLYTLTLQNSLYHRSLQTATIVEDASSNNKEFADNELLQKVSIIRNTLSHKPL